MTIPDSVKIGGITYAVNIADRLRMGDNYTGEIDYIACEINLREQAPAKMEADFLHELVHGMYHCLGYYDHDEKKIEEFAQLLYAVIVDNPNLFARKAATHVEPAVQQGAEGPDTCKHV